MEAGVRLAAYGAGLVVAFGASYGIAAAAVPDEVVARWSEPEPSHVDTHADAPPHEAADAADHAPTGVSLEADGYRLSPVRAPTRTGSAGTLSFRVLDAHGEPLTQYTRSHEQDLHLVVVRSDGSGYRHEHPRLDRESGTWSLPWTWDEGGTHRVYADFTPGGTPAKGVTLSRTVDVTGAYTPVAQRPSRTDEVDGYTVTIDGELEAGTATDLSVSIERDGHPVTDVQPYLGAFGHLVALREGDLAYLHVHARGKEPGAGATAGPGIDFTAETPTAGRYLLYLDFRVDDEVRTATFVIDAAEETR